jgi:hypothetical protein
MNNRKKERKIKQKKLSIGIALGLLLIVVLGVFFIGNALTKGSNSYFARIRVAIKKKVQIVYNYNMFVANKITHDVIKKYDNKNQIIQINGSMDNKTISLGKICNLKLAKDDKYRITINYVSGSYSSKKDSKPKFVFDFQKDGKYYDDRQNGIHYISGTLPTKDITYDKVAIVKDETVESNCFSFRMYQNENDSTTFKNYKKSNLRQALCQIDKNNFLIITTTVLQNADYSIDRWRGLPITTDKNGKKGLAQIMLDYNCVT